MIPRYDYQLSRKPIHLDQVRRMPGYDTAKKVPRVTADISQREFMESYWAAAKPVVITGGVRHWRAFDAWKDIDYLRRTAGDEQILVSRGLVLDLLLMKISERVAPTKHGPSVAQAIRSFVHTMKVTEYLDRCTTHWDPETIYHARNIALPSQMLNDTGDLHFCGLKISNKTIFFGRRSFTDSHEHSGSDAFACIVRGAKEFILHPPDRTNYRALYSNRLLKNWSPVRFFDVDLQRFPLFAQSTPMIARLSAGDAMYIPNPYWHSVVSSDDDLECNVACWVPTRRIRFLRHPASRKMMFMRARESSSWLYGSARRIVHSMARGRIRPGSTP
jgi:hypothetical protein